MTRAAALIAVALIAAAIGAFLTWQFEPVPQAVPARLVHFVVRLPVGDSLDPGLRPAVALSPDGSKLVYAANRQGTSHLFLRRLDRVEPILLPGTDDASGPFFSPDGQSIGFFASGKLMKTAVEGGVPVTLAGAPSARGAVWAADGTIVFSAAPGIGLWRLSAAGGQPTSITRLAADGSERTHRWPDMLPGSAALLMTVRGVEHVSFDQTSIVPVSLTSGERGRQLVQGTQPRYVKSGHLLFARAGLLYGVVFDPVRLSVQGAPVAVLDNVMTDPSTGAAQYAVSADGVLAYVRGPEWVPERNVDWIDRGGRAERALDRASTFSSPRVSPDGRRIAVGVGGASDNIWVTDAASGNLTRLTFETGSHTAPVWTPNGRRIAFASNASGAYNLFWKNADGSDTAERLTQSTQLQIPTSWSADGSLLAFTQSDPGTGSDIWVLSVKDGYKVRPLVQTQFNEHGATFSPDGHWLAYCSDESGREEIYVQPFPGPGEKRQISSDGGREPVWARRGDALFYRRGSDVIAVGISVVGALTVGHPATVVSGDFASGEMGGAPGYDVSPDGRRLLLIRENRLAEPTSIDVILNWFEELKAKVPGK